MRLVGWFQIVLGVGIVGLWIMLLLTGVPEVAEGRLDIWFHIAAEVILAGALITAGWSTLRRAPRAKLYSGIGFGALVYSVVNSSGYYAQRGQWPLVGLFGLLLVGAGWLFGRSWGPLSEANSARATAPDREGVPA